MTRNMVRKGEYGVGAWALSRVFSVASASALIASRSCNFGGERNTWRHLPRRFLSFGDDRGIEEMRKLLESSWNVETMGDVPTDANAAADAAVTSLMNAMRQQEAKAVFLIDVLLPQYDIRQGASLYDEVLAVEFCTALSKKLPGKTAIIVRDDKTIQTVSRVLDARERHRVKFTLEDTLPDTSTTDDLDDDHGDSFDNKDDLNQVFAEFDDIGGSSAGNVESFRTQLISNWNNQSLTAQRYERTREQSRSLSFNKSFRLTSMLGSAKISSGADMVTDVVNAVSSNARPQEDESNLIILSAASREEMIGVRGVVSTFQGKKTIILVNCSFDPIPRELHKAQTVYSIQPFIARPVVSVTNIFGAKGLSAHAQNAALTKVVVMRRYPRDWEIYVDFNGKGFELAQTIPAQEVNKKGPSMKYIASCVKQFLQSRANN